MERILARLDEHLNRNDYAAAERHLLFWLNEKRGTAVALTLYNELLGIYRKTGQKEKAMETLDAALITLKALSFEKTVSGATTYLNAATVLHAFGEAEKSIPLFDTAREIYEKELPADDARLAGLYNNSATALVSVGRFAEANALYEKALALMAQFPWGGLECAVTHLNIASAVEAERGLLDAEEEISHRMDLAAALLEKHEKRDGYYAFVCEKCAPVFGYYGRFRYEKELKERARKIYEGA